MWTGMLVIAVLLLTVNTVVTYVQLATPYRNWGTVYQKLPRLVKQQGLKHAVVFIPNHRGAPIGDYPFEPFERANIIYFKLGPAPRWRLNESDPDVVYQQYFRGRSAYLYEDGGLRRIRPR